MTDNTDSSTGSNAVAVPAKGGTSPWALAAIVVVALTALGFAVYAWYQVAVITQLKVGEQGSTVTRVREGFDELRNSQEDTGKRVSTLERSVEELGRETRASLDAEKQTREKSISEFRVEFDALSASLEQVYRDLGRTLDTWILEEVEQLLLLANQRLNLARDVTLASAALSIADSKLEEVGDPALLPVRKQLAVESNALAQVQAVDVAGSALRLQALMRNVSGLPLNEDMSGPEWETGEAPLPEAGDNGTMDTLQRAGREFVSDLSKLVRIRKVEDTRLPKLKPVQRFLVYENVRLSMNAAHNALLMGNSEVYQGALAGALADVQRFVAQDAEATRRFIADLEQLKALNLEPELPRIETSLNLLQSIIKERRSQ